jgi:hypothetical protein
VSRDAKRFGVLSSAVSFTEVVCVIPLVSVLRFIYIYYMLYRYYYLMI